LVVLDEATSSLDSDTDELIREVLRANFADCTVISIAHRVSLGRVQRFANRKLILTKEATILEADMVIKMDAGHVSAVITPSEVL
jgi:ATP-binding cassette subfamily C (CFTR/MRP) protein 1